MSAKRRFASQSVASVRREADAAAQNRCPHGNEHCNGLGGPGLACFECLTEAEA